ncbi:MAG: hypothetical protein KDD33_11820 [Bdellovibrionales bacterium]|nr:hypothetical protein [Bdellovibrionales bacterium]
MGAKILLSLALTFLTQPCWAAQTGKKAAQKYFVKKGEEGRSTASTSITSAGNYKGLFTLSAGTLFASKSYNWAEQQSPTGWSLQLDYHRRLKSSFFATVYQLEMQKFQTSPREASKLSFLFGVTVPKNLEFPVYIGVAAGPGIFLKQLAGESLLTLDYKGFVGLRYNQDHSQFFLESGVKNHVNVLSDGQLSSWFLASGVAYKF